ncbi:LGFP repeat-containing protein [Corynebacterium oculi]|uniref:LGFP repeat protein n=1 Tax=Corynebacterium oculi TaxID=1544416 RepID=A0A0N8VZE4_9CORY|nr:hypothetical protein [Corynebacterium oculi]KQB83666.1 LGFP repeat protein [Corynebacterium oculi]
MNRTVIVAAAALALGAGILSGCTPTENVAGTARGGGPGGEPSVSASSPAPTEGKLPEEVERAVATAEKEGVEVVAVTTADKQRYLVELNDGVSLVYSPDTGMQKISGKIAGIWMGEGALSAPVGLPVAAEEALPEERGWTQKFERGQISWARDEKDQYQVEVQS